MQRLTYFSAASAWAKVTRVPVDDEIYHRNLSRTVKGTELQQKPTSPPQNKFKLPYELIMLCPADAPVQVRHFCRAPAEGGVNLRSLAHKHGRGLGHTTDRSAGHLLGAPLRAHNLSHTQMPARCAAYQPAIKAAASGSAPLKAGAQAACSYAALSRPSDRHSGTAAEAPCARLRHHDGNFTCGHVPPTRPSSTSPPAVASSASLVAGAHPGRRTPRRGRVQGRASPGIRRPRRGHPTGTAGLRHHDGNFTGTRRPRRGLGLLLTRLASNRPGRSARSGPARSRAGAVWTWKPSAEAPNMSQATAVKRLRRRRPSGGQVAAEWRPSGGPPSSAVRCGRRRPLPLRLGLGSPAGRGRTAGGPPAAAGSVGAASAAAREPSEPAPRARLGADAAAGEGLRRRTPGAEFEFV